MIRPTLKCSEVFLVWGRSGDYEPSYWVVGAWTTWEDAEAAAKKLNDAAETFWQKKKDLGEPPDTAMPDEQWEPLYDAWEGRLEALLDEARAAGDDLMDKWEPSSYTVKKVPLHAR